MWLTQWFKNNIQSKLPYESKVRVIVLIAFIAIVCMVLIVIHLHKYTHTFWQDKPVAWTTILPTLTGLLRNNVLPSFRSIVQELPNNMHIKDIQWSSSLSKDTKSTITKELSLLWNIKIENVHEALAIPDTRLVLAYENNKVIGSIVFYPTIIHTPVEENLNIFVAHHLHINETYRKQDIAIHVMEKALDIIRKEKQYEPVVLFAVPYRTELYSKNRLPFAEVARVMRVQCTINPITLPDPDITVTHSVVHSAKHLPHKTKENSSAHIQTKLTLEPAGDNIYRRNHWDYCIKQPNHLLLSIGGEDWIHLIHNHNTEDDTIIFKGCSYDGKDMHHMVSHLMHYIKHNVSDGKLVHIILPQSLVSTFDTHSIFPKDNAQSHTWDYHDGHFIYMYNYKLNCVNVNIPYTMDISLW